MTPVEDLWKSLDQDPSALPGLLLRRLDVPGFDVHLTQERPSRMPGLLVYADDKPGTLWKYLKSSHGLDVRLDVRPGQRATLALTEKNEHFHSVFTALVTDLVRGLEHLATTPPVERPLTLDYLSARISSWQSCLKESPEGMSGEKAAGLFGELRILTMLLDAGLDPMLCLDRWTGPANAIQDFQFDQVTIEVKTSRQTQPANVRITSERQLDTTTHNRLVLVHLSLDERADTSATTLPEGVAAVRALLGTGKAGLTLDEQLVRYGYLDAHEHRYSNRSYAVRAIDFIDVVDPIPRLVEKDLPAGVGRVSYDLSLASCEPFRLDEQTMQTLISTITS